MPRNRDSHSPAAVKTYICGGCGAELEGLGVDHMCDFGSRVELRAENERLLRIVCDALKHLPSPHECAGTAILCGLLKGTSHDGHNTDTWGNP